MYLDIPTLLVTTMINFAVALAAAVFVWRVNRSVEGLASVASGVGAICCGFGLAFFGGAWLGKSAIWFGNTAMVVGLLLILDGVRRFRGFRPLNWRLAAAISTPFIVAQTYFLFAHDDRAIRTGFLSFLIAGICFAAARAMVSRVDREDLFTYGLTACGLTLYGLSQLLRSVLALVPQLNRSHLIADALPALGLVVLNVCLTGCLFGMAAATNLKLRKRIHAFAFCDSLTGLPNRRRFEECLSHVRKRSLSSQSPAALIYIDVDHFKTVNDRFGHSEGDLALKRVADRLRQVVSREDCLARMGGDEFVVLTERHSTREDARRLVAALEHALESAIPISGSVVHLSVSCGLAFYPYGVPDVTDVIAEADAQMYVSKRRVTATS